MTIVQAEDTRNVEWRSNNKGSALLQKMGWTEGMGIGKRSSNTTALRAVKRQEGLGLGAKMQTEGGQSESTNTFAAVLKNLQQHHGEDNDSGSSKSSDSEKKSSSKKNRKKKDKSSKKKKRKGLTLPQNKVTAGHAQKMRLAKFGEKSADDLACIFGNKNMAASAAPATVSETSSDVGDADAQKLLKKEKKDKKKKRSRDASEKSAVASEQGEKKKRKLDKSEKKAKKAKKESR